MTCKNPEFKIHFERENNPLHRQRSSSSMRMTTDAKEVTCKVCLGILSYEKGGDYKCGGGYLRNGKRRAFDNQWDYREKVVRLGEEIDRLEKQLKEAEGADKILRFYANNDNWASSNGLNHPLYYRFSTIIPDDDETVEFSEKDKPCFMGGKRAREYFKNKELKNDND